MAKTEERHDTSFDAVGVGRLRREQQILVCLQLGVHIATERVKFVHGVGMRRKPLTPLPVARDDPLMTLWHRPPSIQATAPPLGWPGG